MNDNKTKPNLLLLHGALGTKNQFNSILSSLDRDFNVLSINFEGHGDESSNTDFTLHGFTDNIITFLNQKNIDKTHILGYSMGGYVALNLAITNPEMVKSIITLGTKFEWDPQISAREIQMLNPQKIQEKVPAFVKHLENIHPANHWKELLIKTAGFIEGLGNGKGLDNSLLAKISHKVLVFLGNEDKMVSREESEKLAQLIPNGTLEIIDGFRHEIDKNDLSVLIPIIKRLVH